MAAFPISTVNGDQQEYKLSDLMHRFFDCYKIAIAETESCSDQVIVGLNSLLFAFLSHNIHSRKMTQYDQLS